jgi:hypothetical protein
VRLWPVLGAALSLLAVSCVAPASLMTWHQYRASAHHWPYIMEATATTGRLYYFGAEHTNDPLNTEIAELETAWNMIKPTRAFNEGGDPPVVSARDEEIRLYGEAGFVRWIAARDGVPVETLDLSRREQAQSLLARWSVGEAKTFFIQRALLPCEDRADCDREVEMNRILPIIETSSGLTTPPHNWPEFQDRLKRVEHATSNSHRQWFDPTQDGHPFNAMTREVEDARDRHMIAVLLEAVRHGARVFAVAGGSHVVRQERALRAGM